MAKNDPNNPQLLDNVQALIEALKVSPVINQLYLDHSVCNKAMKGAYAV